MELGDILIGAAIDDKAIARRLHIKRLYQVTHRGDQLLQKEGVAAAQRREAGQPAPRHD